LKGAKTTTELCPPNPNEFEIAENACQNIRKESEVKIITEKRKHYEVKYSPTFTSCCFFSFGTVSNSTAGSIFYKYW
jgi:hypothetical protein